MTKTMLMREYLENGGERCPFCRSFSVHPTPKLRDCEDGDVRRLSMCFSCGKKWDEVYKLKRYEDRDGK